MNRCGMCKWWDPFLKPDGNNEDRGVCDKLEGGNLDCFQVVPDLTYPDVQIQTSEVFGCVLWERRIGNVRD